MFAFYCRSQKNVFHLSCNYNILKIWFLKDALELMMMPLLTSSIVVARLRYISLAKLISYISSRQFLLPTYDVFGFNDARLCKGLGGVAIFNFLR